jgi:hypothetical protein
MCHQSGVVESALPHLSLGRVKEEEEKNQIINITSARQSILMQSLCAQKMKNRFRRIPFHACREMITDVSANKHIST